MINIKNEEFIKKLGRRIIVLRHERGLSQEELANLADIPLAQIGRIERGKVKVGEEVELISIGLELHLSDLLNFEYE